MDAREQHEALVALVKREWRPDEYDTKPTPTMINEIAEFIGNHFGEIEEIVEK